MLEENKVKRKFEEGILVVGTCAYTNSPILVELAGFCGMDFIRIDNEHSWRRDESAENMMRAAANSGIVPILRIDNDPDVIRKALEIGAGGILIPHINTAEEVEGIVEAAKFPPVGSRGTGSLCFSARWGTERISEWMAWSNEELLIGVMIEDYRAVPHLDEIMAVEGLDYVLFGPGDYSVSIGLPGQMTHPKVMEALQRTIDAANRHGKYVMKGVGYPWVENAKRLIDMGVHAIEMGHDVSILRDIWRRQGSEIRKLAQ
ncbi:MAG: HpcH/HpaI aldolase family protein [Candidatus Bathyarchaeia archaeon]